MAKTLLGIDIGSNDIKMALFKGGSEKLVNERLPDNLVRDNRIVSNDLMARYMRQLLKKNKIRTRSCAVILPDFSTYFRRLSVPAMTREQLELNLPYEFRDYVGNQSEDYFYDYLVEKMNLDESGEPVSIDLMASAAQKSIIKEYTSMFKRAGLRLVLALPREMALVNILKRHLENSTDAEKDYLITDIGIDHTRIFIFKGNSLDATKIYDIGCKQIDEAISSEFNIDEHLAANYRLSDHEGCLSRPACLAVYERISVEVIKVRNFYSYNNPDSELGEIYLCGDGAGIKPLVDTITGATHLEPHGINELISGRAQAEADIIRCAMAIGVAL